MMAFVTVDEEISDAEYLIEESQNILGATNVIFEVSVDDYGNISLAAVSDDYHVIGTRKIKFCPMCGSEIPQFTSRYRYDHKEV